MTHDLPVLDGTRWQLLTLTTGLLAAASGGAFLTFSTLTTTALGDLPPRVGMVAIQQMNVAAPRSPVFMALLFGPALLAAVVGVRAVTHWEGRPSALALAGAVVYVVGVAGMTAAFHVPRNDALAAMDAARDAGGFASWLQTWVAGNHVRTVSGLLSGALLLLAAR